MARLDYLWVIHMTSKAANAGTDDAFELQILSVLQGTVVAQLPFPELPHDERERDRTDEYRFDVRDLDIDMFGLNEDNFCIRILGSDMWLPHTIWIIGQDTEGRRQLLAGWPEWPDDLWFSRDATEGAGRRCLDEPTRLMAAKSA